MIEQTWVVGPFQCNCRLLACPDTGEAVLVDPGDEPAKILRNLEGLTTPTGKPIVVRHLFHTHAHLDHIGATRSVKEAKPSSRIYLHKYDEEIYLSLKMQGKLFGISYEDPLPIDSYFEDNQELKVGSLKFTVLHTPGHSPGGVSIRLHEDSKLGLRESILTGDTLFQGSVGRTDLWGANQDQMFASIRDRILVLDGDTRVCPGHGPDSSVAIEKRENPFLI